jgi:hypothetical protein
MGDEKLYYLFWQGGKEEALRPILFSLSMEVMALDLAKEFEKEPVFEFQVYFVRK